MKQQSGAAILTAMLTVTLVAALSAAALWQQWRGIEVETAERARVQSGWILKGALDWARLILREDARSGSTDHLAEPWAVPLQEARLSTFLAAGQTEGDTGEGLEGAFLSGQIIDLQSRLNTTNLIEDGKVHAPTLRAFSRLFSALRLPESELLALSQNLRLALAPADEGDRPLVPHSLEQLAWLGLSLPTIETLRPFVTVLPERTPVNINTASAPVLFACIGTATQADAQRLVAARAQAHFRSLADANKLLGGQESAVVEGLHGLSTRFFEVSGQVRLGTRSVQERSVVQRDGLVVKVLWRQRGALPSPATLGSLQWTATSPP